jgi:DNA-binding PadR family transcriptional regulator
MLPNFAEAWRLLTSLHQRLAPAQACPPKRKRRRDWPTDGGGAATGNWNPATGNPYLTFVVLYIYFTYIYVINKAMKGTNLGEFEELVLLTIAALLSDAYSVAICDELEKNAGRAAKLGVVHAVLNRLEEKGYVKSKLGESTSERGGKRKRYYTVTNGGKAALIRVKEIRDQLWSRIPELSLKKA